MSDERYSYQKVNVVKMIVSNNEGKVLLVQEPSDNEWMPNHWGLPGGKPLNKESLIEAFKRKIKDDVGYEVESKGVFKIEELLIDGRTVLMFIFVTEIPALEIKGEVQSYKWVDEQDIRNMDVADFTEFYNKQLLLDYFANPQQLALLSLIDTLKYYELSNDPEYQKWFNSGRKND